MPLLEITGLQKAFSGPDGSTHRVIDIRSLVIAQKAQVAISGESGLGKTTMLHLIAGILKPDAGSIKLLGREISNLSEAQRDRVRAESIGYVFQTFNLLPAFTSLENVLLGMTFGRGVDRLFAEGLLKRVGLDGRLRHYPHQLSTGQQQRVAVARALANRPKLVLADEPTGNLDAGNSHEALKLIREVCAENGAALLLVSHDRDVLARFDTVLLLKEINKAEPRAEVWG
jgi:putative ABC transport system ATP-binding protein